MNQKEMAKKLRVSQTTVSMVLNNPSTKKVSADKRRRIMELMRESNYLLRSRCGKTWNIGYVLGGDGGFRSRFFEGIQKSASEAGYNVIVDHGIKNSRLVAHRKVDGIILEEKLGASDLASLAKQIPLVLLNDSPRQTVCDIVAPDNQGGVAKAMDHLTELGHSRVAFFGLLPPDRTMCALLRERKEMFEAEARRRGLRVGANMVRLPVMRDASVAETERLVGETLSLWSGLANGPTAVLCCNDFYGAVFLRVAAERGVKVPGRLSVIGTDNTPECEFTYPQLTSIDHDTVEMERLAVELLLKRIAFPERPFARISCGSSLVIRKSSGPVKK